MMMTGSRNQQEDFKQFARRLMYLAVVGWAIGMAVFCTALVYSGPDHYVPRAQQEEE